MKKHILCLGDSNTHGYCADPADCADGALARFNEEERWTRLLQKSLGEEYLVVEDAFPNGRPPLEQAGVYFTDRLTVERSEKMKVGTCLNPLHTALAIFGCLLGYRTSAADMQDP